MAEETSTFSEIVVAAAAAEVLVDATAFEEDAAGGLVLAFFFFLSRPEPMRVSNHLKAEALDNMYLRRLRS